MRRDWYREYSPKVLVEMTNENGSEYVQAANDFAERYGVKLYLLACDYGYYFPDDKDERWIYKMQLVRDGRAYTFTFGQSIAAGDTVPTYYDVLAAMTKYDPYDFEDFCSEYGYSQWDEYGRRNKTAYETYKAVKREYEAIERLFGDVMDELQEIQ